MSEKLRDKQALQTAKNDYRTLVNDVTIDATEKWNRIRQKIKQFRVEAASILNNGSCGVVAHDRRAKLAAFACEYATVYYERLARETRSPEEKNDCERRLGDLARYLTGIKNVPRAAPQLTVKEESVREYWTIAALRHYDALQGSLKVYNFRIQRLIEERQEDNALLSFMFMARKAINDQDRPQREKTLALDEAVRGMVNLGGIYRDFANIAIETMQAAVNCSPLQLSHTAHTRLLKLWNTPAHDYSVEALVSLIIALVLIAFYTKTMVANVKPLYQQLLKSERLHTVLIDTFVENKESLKLSPLLRLFLNTTKIDGQPLTDKVRILNTYPVEF